MGALSPAKLLANRDRGPTGALQLGTQARASIAFSQYSASAALSALQEWHSIYLRAQPSSSALASPGLEDTIFRGGRRFLISGERGIGKTRLTKELAELAGAQGVRVVGGVPGKATERPAIGRGFKSSGH